MKVTSNDKLNIGADILRRNAYLALVCSKAGIENNGTQMEYFFEPEKIKKSKRTGHVIRSCKYDRYFHGRNPSIQTTKLINDKLNGTAEVFTSPFWSALSLIAEENPNFSELYLKLSIDIQSILFESKRDEFNQLIRRELTSQKIEKIAEIGGLHALTCLISLYAEGKTYISDVSRIYLEQVVYEQFLFCCINDYFSSAQDSIFHYLKVHLFKHHKARYLLWKKNSTAFAEHEKKIRTIFSLAIRTGIIRSLDTVPQFLYWYEKGHKALISRELKYFHSPHSELLKTEAHGVKWLVSKLKRYYTRSEQGYFKSLHKQL